MPAKIGYRDLAVKYKCSTVVMSCYGYKNEIKILSRDVDKIKFMNARNYLNATPSGTVNLSEVF